MPIYEYSCEACGREFETLVLGRRSWRRSGASRGPARAATRLRRRSHTARVGIQMKVDAALRQIRELTSR